MNEEEELELEILEEKEELEMMEQERAKLDAAVLGQGKVEETEVEEENVPKKKLEELSPESDWHEAEKAERRSRRSSGLRLSSAPSFGSSPQAELASSPQLKRSVRRQRPKQGSSSESSGDEDEEDGSDVKGHVIVSDIRKEEVHNDEEGALDQGKKAAFVSAAKAYEEWVKEALEDLAFREFGDTLEEVRDFKEVLDDSDKDISLPNYEKYHEILKLGEDCGCDTKETKELHDSILVSIENRRKVYDSLLKKLEEDEKAEAQKKKQEEEEEAKPPKSSIAEIDFDISKELASLDGLAFDFDDKKHVPSKPETESAAADVSKELEGKQPEPVSNPSSAVWKSGDIVEALYDGDNLWYKAKIEEETDFGFWLTFVEYGNSQDTSVDNIRPLNTGAKKGMKKQKNVMKNKAVADSGVVPPKPEQQDEDVRAPEGGIAARLKMLSLKEEEENKSGEKTKEEEKEEAEEEKKKEREEEERKRKDEEEEVRKKKEEEERKKKQEEEERKKKEEEEEEKRRKKVEQEEERMKKEDEELKKKKKQEEEERKKKEEEEEEEEEDSKKSASPPNAKSPDLNSSSDRLRSSDIRSRASEALKNAQSTSRSSSNPDVNQTSPPAARLDLVDTSSMSESELKAHKLKLLREQLKAQRESSASGSPSPVSKNATALSSTVSSKNAKKERPVFSILDGDEDVPELQSLDEVLTLSTSAVQLGCVGNFVVPADVPPRDKKRLEAFISLVENERDYYDQLATLMAMFMLPLQSRPVEILSADEIKELFGNVDIIWGIHKLLLGSLCKIAEDWNVDSVVGNCLSVFVPALKVYNLYTAHVGKAMVALTKFKTKHPKAKEFKQFVQETEMKPECHGTNLRTLLNAPVRRPAQYGLLVRALQRATNKTHDDFVLLEDVCKELDKK